MTPPQPPAPVEPDPVAAWQSGWLTGYLAAVGPIRCARKGCHETLSAGAVRRGFRHCSKACRQAATRG